MDNAKDQIQYVLSQPCSPVVNNNNVKHQIISSLSANAKLNLSSNLLRSSFRSLSRPSLSTAAHKKDEPDQTNSPDSPAGVSVVNNVDGFTYSSGLSMVLGTYIHTYRYM